MQIVEAGEALLAAKARWWKKEKDFKGVQHLKEEIVDTCFFAFSAFLSQGGTADEFYEIYTQKHKFNTERKDWQINHEPTQTNPGDSSST
jgi:hypothetical protein